MAGDTPVNGRSDSEKLHFAEQKLRCDNQYFSEFAKCKDVDNLAFWGKWLLGAAVALAIGAFVYTFAVSNILASNIIAGDSQVATQIAAASGDRANLRTDVETQKVRYEFILKALETIQSDVKKLAEEKAKSKE